MYIIDSLPFKTLIPNTMASTIQEARKNKHKWVLVEEAFGPDYVTHWERVEVIQKASYTRGTKVYNRRVGYPFGTIKRAVKVLNKFGIPVEDFFDGNHDNTNSSADEYVNEENFSDEELEEIAWAVSALQWAGFQDPEVLCAYDPASYAYKYEKKLLK